VHFFDALRDLLGPDPGRHARVNSVVNIPLRDVPSSAVLFVERLPEFDGPEDGHHTGDHPDESSTGIVTGGPQVSAR
jgi:hypothetical protein